MRILIANNYYYIRGGAETHVFALARLLKKHGHEVRHFSMDYPKNLPYEHSEGFVSNIHLPEEVKKRGLILRLKALFRRLYSKEARDKFRKVLNEFKPEVIHLHNINQYLTTSIILEANKQKIPVVWTLHDYNLICLNIRFLSRKGICEECKKHRYLAPLKERCYRDSLAASGIIVIEKLLHDIQGIKEKVNLFISPSVFLKEKFLEYGFTEKEISVIPYFYEVKETQEYNNDFKDKYYLFLGRISPEKGIETLCKAAQRAKIKLIIAGEGPIKEELEKEYGSKDIRFVGYKTGVELANLRKNAWFVVVPSEWHENNPFSIIESFADCVPVIGAGIGGISELIRENETGFLFKPKNVENLTELLNRTSKLTVKDRNELGKMAREHIKANNNPEIYHTRILRVYKEAIVHLQ